MPETQTAPAPGYSVTAFHDHAEVLDAKGECVAQFTGPAHETHARIFAALFSPAPPASAAGWEVIRNSRSVLQIVYPDAPDGAPLTMEAAGDIEPEDEAFARRVVRSCAWSDSLANALAALLRDTARGTFQHSEPAVAQAEAALAAYAGAEAAKRAWIEGRV